LWHDTRGAILPDVTMMPVVIIGVSRSWRSTARG
jgi:hypothetical protein